MNKCYGILVQTLSLSEDQSYVPSSHFWILLFISNPLKIRKHLQPIEIQVNKKMKLKKKINKIS
jgi:hypothetical protein